MSCGSSSPGASSRGFRFPAEIINQAAGYTTASASACASRVNPGGAGYRGQLRDHPRVAPALRASLTPGPSSSGGCNPATSGFSIRCSSASEANFIICG
jgi:hypothetical protein